jgi:hypothetical protein
MEIPRDKVVGLLRDRGQGDVADQAEQRLPENIDLDQHADLLKEHGLEPQQLAGHLGL